MRRILLQPWPDATAIRAIVVATRHAAPAPDHGIVHREAYGNDAHADLRDGPAPDGGGAFNSRLFDPPRRYCGGVDAVAGSRFSGPRRPALANPVAAP